MKDTNTRIRELVGKLKYADAEEAGVLCRKAEEAHSMSEAVDAWEF